MKTPAPTFLHQAVLKLTLVPLAFALTSCSESKSIVCSAARACPEGWACAADGKTCIQTVCGDGVQQSGEACDDGNTEDGDKCNSTCTSNEKCGNGYIDVVLGEQCDDGDEINDNDCSNDCRIARCGDGVVSSRSVGKEECDDGGLSESCNLDCTTASCGDGLVSLGEECDNGLRQDTDKCTTDCKVSTCGDNYVNQAADEECDDGNKDDLDDCLSTCKWNRCGDGHINPPKESCDDGNTATEPACAYGTQSCTVCPGDCSKPVQRAGSYCGDGTQDPGEACDDGNTVNESRCSRGAGTCEACSADCSELLSIPGPVCGNGIHEFWWGEDCDDGNADSCGSCDAYCENKTSQTKAIGYITATLGSNIEDGDLIIINDGVHVPVFFEFDKGTGTATWTRPINIQNSQDANAVAASIRSAIKAIPDETLSIITKGSGNPIELEHLLSGGVGNQSILETVNHAGFSVKGMTGGKPYGCSETVGCAKDSDCAPGFTCTNKRCANSL
jgi:cysteine-rich repeat protein